MKWILLVVFFYGPSTPPQSFAVSTTDKGVCDAVRLSMTNVGSVITRYEPAGNPRSYAVCVPESEIR